MTKIINLKEYKNKEQLGECADALRNGKLVIFPTETVYGIGASIFNSDAIDNIFLAKNRLNDNPLIVHISNFEMINDLVININEVEKKLIDAFFPGPFTLVLPKNENVTDNITAGLNTVGIRMPDNKIAHDLIELAGVPIAAPSANLSSKPSGTRVEDIIDEFDDKVEYIIDGGETEIGIESTVVKVIDNIPVILRPGKITPENIKEVIGVVKVSDTIFRKVDGIVESPGMKYKHYAPKTKCILIYGENDEEVQDEINKIKTNKTVVIGYNELEDKIDCYKYIEYGNKNDYDTISHNIFAKLREADKLNSDLIIILGVKKESLGIAIMNRLIRASEYNYIEL